VPGGLRRAEVAAAIEKVRLAEDSWNTREPER
jgi:nuclear transport factor 2 (NTF2) superfamily protein